MEFTVFFSKTFVIFLNTNKIKVTQIYNLFSILEDLMKYKSCINPPGAPCAEEVPLEIKQLITKYDYICRDGVEGILIQMFLIFQCPR